ncbi:WEE protein kinase, variant [Aphanomyces astaci]|uniref:WEE protein kinase, variant n=1 Tax=Aphanomyces astaci TaxID=112090 RepID=W4FX79_APHAT|nr:WEE protein kinase, variant [Aphanomyces astaci]ETV72110.1 WEE protein kinase, variant [Aphanomyces astaci]|eukprot:XP_009838553.1 WEE protein kinase, variant [Aphanomyces astaci]
MAEASPCSPLPHLPASPPRQSSKTNYFPSSLSPVRHSTPSAYNSTGKTWSPRSPCIRVNLSAQFDEADSDDGLDSTAIDSAKTDSSTSSIDLSETFLFTYIEEGGRDVGPASVAGRARSSDRRAVPTTCPTSPARAAQWTKRRLGTTRTTRRAAVIPAMNRLHRQNSLVSTKLLVTVAPLVPSTRSKTSIPPRWLPFESFQNVRPLGSGAHSDVFAVIDDQGIRYAVKKSKHKLRGRRDRDLRLREIRIYDRVQNDSTNDSDGGVQEARCRQYVLQYFHAWQEQGYLYMQTELCPRGALPNAIQSSKLSEALCWRILHDVASGLSYLHSRGIVHLDIKPANLLVTATMVKIGDLGLAQCDSHQGENGLTTNEGDSAYMAPELLQSTARQPSADIFSLGLTLVELATGVALPSQGPQWHVLRSGSLPHRTFDTAYSADFDVLIRQMLRVDPTKRPTAQDVMAHPKVNEAAQVALFPIMKTR